MNGYVYFYIYIHVKTCSVDQCWLNQVLSISTPSVSCVPLLQAAKQRGLKMTWCTVNGHQVGAPAGDSKVSLGKMKNMCDRMNNKYEGQP